jgi:hypothetical protein
MGMWILHNGHVEFEQLWLGQVDKKIVSCKGTKKRQKRPHGNQYLHGEGSGMYYALDGIDGIHLI